jgi:hypothetical protein
MTSKIRIKLGPIEVEYEGSEDFLKEELPQLLEAVANLHKKSGITDASPQDQNQGGSSSTPKGQLQGTTGAVAAKLGSKTGPDLVLAAAARLTLVVGKETFTRKDLLAEMKTATAYYKATYRGNLSGYLNGLVKDGILLETAAQTYSLSASKKTELGKQLA